MFFGGTQPDWVDLNRVQVPAADEQQRMLANLVIGMENDRMPLPRFWYLPRGLKAAVVLTGDDHNYNLGGTNGQFNRYLADSPPGCSVALWQCVRSTSYLFPGTSVSERPGGRPSRPRASSSRCTSGCRGTPPGRRRATATATTSRAPRPWPATSRCSSRSSARPTRASRRR